MEAFHIILVALISALHAPLLLQQSHFVAAHQHRVLSARPSRSRRLVRIPPIQQPHHLIRRHFSIAITELPYRSGEPFIRCKLR